MRRYATSAWRAIALVAAWRVAEAVLLVGAGALLAVCVAAHGLWVGAGGLACLVCWGLLTRLEPFSIILLDEHGRGWELYQWRSQLRAGDGGGGDA